MRLRLPPRIKVLEAAGALGDGRVVILETGDLYKARVTSSTGERVYRVLVDLEDGRGRAYSDDNGTRYRGYVGYPIIAVLMAAGVLPRDPGIERVLSRVPWKVLNERYRRYSVVERIVLERASRRGVPESRVLAYVEDVMDALSGLELYYDEGLLDRF